MIELDDGCDGGGWGGGVPENGLGENVVNPCLSGTSDVRADGGRRVEGDQSVKWGFPRGLLESV